MMPTPKRLFKMQKYNAERRGIAFNFTYEEWLRWWHYHLGPDWQSKRGKASDKFVMARHADKGPYQLDNVACITFSENSKQRNILNSNKGEKNGSAKLCETDIVKIRKSKLSEKQLAVKYGVVPRRIRRIRKYELWPHVK
jgi:hypothetical protein